MKSEYVRLAHTLDPRTIALAIKIADASALCTIESACAADDWRKPDAERWWKTDEPNKLARAHVKEAMKYLEMRRVLEHHPEHPTWVRWPDELPAQGSQS